MPNPPSLVYDIRRRRLGRGGTGFNEAMGKARRDVVDPVNPGTYHVVSRCVRREHLLGRDRLTGRDRSHRRTWLTEGILFLGDLFAVEVYALAVMGNHFHLVLHEDPKASLAWDATLVAQRYVMVFPPLTAAGNVNHARVAECIDLLLDSPAGLARARRVLGSMSSYMKHLKQPIARRANIEDGCTGHFFQQRFWCGRLETEEAVLSTMCYVDLNPVRAGLVATPADWAHTSAALRQLRGTPTEERLLPLASGLRAGGQRLRLASSYNDYLVRLTSLADVPRSD